MATIRVKPLFLTPAKTLCKIILICIVIIFICRKLFGWNPFGETVPSVGSSLDEKIQNFQQNDGRYPAAVAGKSTGVFKAKSSRLSESKLNTSDLWSFSESHSNNDIHVLIPFANAKSNPNLQAKFETCVTSISDLSSAQVVLFVMGDKESHTIAERIVKAKKNIQFKFVDLEIVGREMQDVISTMQPHFSYKPDSYYAQTLFFLSIAIHRLVPPTLSHLIMLDADLLFKEDIKLLHDHFDRFASMNVIGIAYENQPVYRHVLYSYRQSNPGTRAGDPPPEGLPGFNSGVLLMDLERLQKSKLYNTLLETDIVKGLATKYSYKGHLGDQDFYSLVSLEYEQLFYVLPCTWNRQLCQWWRDKGYSDVFDKYFACEGKINVYHGNCNTPFPSTA